MCSLARAESIARIAYVINSASHAAKAASVDPQSADNLCRAQVGEDGDLQFVDLGRILLNRHGGSDLGCASGLFHADRAMPDELPEMMCGSDVFIVPLRPHIPMAKRQLPGNLPTVPGTAPSTLEPAENQRVLSLCWMD